MAFVKPLIRFGIVTVLAGGAAAAIVGPERLMAVAGQARVAVQDAVDANVDDPVRIRAQIQDLASQYPERIARVNADLNDLRFQMQSMQKDLAISNRVVELASAELTVMDDRIAQLNAAEAQSGNRHVVFTVSFNGESLSPAQARAKANAMKNTVDTNVRQAQLLTRDLTILAQQEARLAEFKAQQEAEYAEFQADIAALDQQVDMIARNERLTEMLEDYQVAYNDHKSFKGKSLDNVKGNISRILAEQESRLSALTMDRPDQTYAEQAEYELEALLRSGASLDTVAPVKVIGPTEPANAEVIQIGPETSGNSVASR